jgi:hypothetical protein
LSDKVENDWYIAHLQSNGIEVEFWDVVPLLFGGDVAGSKQTDYLRVPQTYQEIKLLLQQPENQGASYIMLVTYEGRTARLYKLLSRLDCRMYFIAWGEFPIKHVRRWNKVAVEIFRPQQLVQKVYFKLKELIYFKLKLIKPFAIVFAAGKALMSQNLNAHKVVPINLVDYDLFNKVKLENQQMVEGRYAVFLDIYLPYQSDLKMVGLQAIDPSNYFASLNRLFDQVESKYGLKVVIAAHPKANYSVDQFKGREIYYGQTPALVNKSDFVISHHSTSVSYAVLNLKPIVFIYTNEMAELYKHTVISNLKDIAEYLDANLFNIDTLTDSNQLIVNEVNKECYDSYKYSFLTTPESENSTTQEIFFHHLFLAE